MSLPPIRKILSVLGVLAGISGCAAFIVLKNSDAASFAAIYTIANILLTYLHNIRLSQRVLQRIKSIVIFCAFIPCTILLGYYSAIEVQTKRPLLPIPSSLILPIIWCCLVLKSLFANIYYCDVYCTVQNNSPHEKVDETSALLEPNGSVESA